MDFLTLSSSSSTAVVRHLGAQVSSWGLNDQEPVLFLSRLASLQNPTPLRGGIPIMFPWFNQGRRPGMLPKHGFARSLRWEFENEGTSADGSTSWASWHLDKELSSNTPGHALFPYRFLARYLVSLSDTLRVSLEVTNLDEVEFDYEIAFHTYLKVGEINQVEILGTNGIEACDPFISKEHFQIEGNLESLCKIDRVLYEAPQLVVRDHYLKRDITISSTGASNLIIWNPGAEGAKTIADMEDNEYRQMLCVEAGRIYDKAVSLEPGQSHEISYELAVSAFK
ncbi:D-hexose-6-phosphate mutarotase [Actinomycetaceae bacterium TAE3-ERU4]|nr:D-hexose-6-phosphate mutarotase [Actinomycetaceae bacterium TAE3-ERU4]